MATVNEFYKSRLFINVSKRAGKAIADYEMLHTGDKIIIAVSGGKDSLTLLNILRFRQSFIPIRIELLAVTVDYGLPNFPLADLVKYFEQIRVPYHIEKVTAVEDGKWDTLDCFRCSQIRRKALFDIADRYGCNKVALGHHMDDIVATILLNLFYHGEVSAMKPKQELFEGKLCLIRPLAYERERTIINLVRKEGWPDFDTFKCPRNDVSKRAEIRKIMEQAQKQNPDSIVNIFRSLKNVKGEYLLDSCRK